MLDLRMFKLRSQAQRRLASLLRSLRSGLRLATINTSLSLRTARNPIVSFCRLFGFRGWLWLLVWLVGVRAHAGVDFNRDIRPILAEKCFACHGPDSAGRKGELRLDQPDGLTDRGVVKPDQPGDSLLLIRIASAEPDEQMPPAKTGKKVTERERALLQQWIREGAKFDSHWAYRPLVKPIDAKVGDSGWPVDWIDRYVLSRLEAESVRPAPPADSRTLVRRLYFDLVGLPPTPADFRAFVDSKDPDPVGALVDRLLASQHFGERMAVFWLDLVRYADTVGYHGDQEHQASPYRDYVIHAFNRNLPFDQFTREQLAGDLLPTPTEEQRIATCYNRLLQTSHEGGVQRKEYLAIYAADRIRNLSGAWLGATVGCAQCHDHKYDPYTMKDFYSLAAYFADVDEEKHLIKGNDQSPTRRDPELLVLPKASQARFAEIQRELADVQAQPQTPTRARRTAELQGERTRLEKTGRLVMVTQSVSPRTVRILPRGNWQDETGPIVTPAPPAFLDRKRPTKTRQNRLDLANWLTDAETGAGALTARVLVNRLWALYFGQGLSKSLDDLGSQGEPASHPELLDALAYELIRSKWNVKHLVRLMVSSQVYRQASAGRPELASADPENRWLARQNAWRLPAEFVRDNALAVAGLLVTEVGGVSARPYQPTGYYRYLNFPPRDYEVDRSRQQYRRGVYMHWQRQFLHPMLKAFDAPSREECTAQRSRSNTAMAALVALNDPTFVEAARGLATRALRERTGADGERLPWMFEQATLRTPTAEELRILEQLLADARSTFQHAPANADAFLKIGLAPRAEGIQPTEMAAWAIVGRAILNLGESMTRE